MLEKIETVDHIEVVENGTVQVRTKIAIMEDGKQISTAMNNHVINPGKSYAAEDARVQAICAATHTADVIAAYKASVAQGV
jgi:archaellum component FlaF (FlaF/FlaG flagellin family)